MKSLHVKKNDEVVVIAGANKGKRGKIIAVNPKSRRVIVEGAAMIKRHTRKDPRRQVAGGVVEREAPIAVSNVMILCSKCGPVRIKRHVERKGNKVQRTRLCVKCGSSLDKK